MIQPPLKILFVVHKSLPESVGGTEVYTDLVARSLSHDHDIFVFTRHDAVSGEPFAEHNSQQNGYSIRRVASHPIGYRDNPLGQFLDTYQNTAIEANFRRFLTEICPDIVHVQHVMALSAELVRISKEAGLPVVCTLHDYWFMCSNSQLVWPDQTICHDRAHGLNCVRCATVRVKVPLLPLTAPLIAPLFSLRDHKVKRAVEWADRLIAPSHFLAEQYVAYGLPGEKFVVLENGIDVERIRHVQKRPRRGPLRVTYLGSIAWQKGVHVLARAFQGLPAEIAELRVYGNPSVFPEYAAEVRRLMDGSNCQFLGQISNDSVGQALAESDVVVVPSLWYENSPVVIQEAFAARVPVIASNLGALTEKVTNEVTGLLFEPGNAGDLRRALLRLAADPILLQRLGDAIQPPRSITDHLRELTSLYQDLHKNPRRTL